MPTDAANSERALRPRLDYHLRGVGEDQPLASRDASSNACVVEMPEAAPRMCGRRRSTAGLIRLAVA